MLDRLLDIRRSFERILVIGPHTERFSASLHARYPEASVTWLAPGVTTPAAGVVIDGDPAAPPFAPSSFDAVLSFMELHVIGDVPGALVQMRSVLDEDGLLLAVFPGGETLRELRYAMTQAELAVAAGAGARVAPMIDVRDAGALLQRAGLALPVADVERLALTYAGLPDLLGELRALGETSCLAGNVQRSLSRAAVAELAMVYGREMADERGRLCATLDLVFIIGWTPSPGQPRALRPGSAEMPLASALRSEPPDTDRR